MAFIISQNIDDFVDLTSNQIISGTKTFTGPQSFSLVTGDYAPLSFSSTWEAYGDSITAGLNLNANQNWPFVLNRALGKTVVNNAVSGYFTTDACTRMYNLKTTDRSTVIFIGTNDLRRQVEQYVTESPDRVLDQSLAAIETMLLYAAIPFANHVNARAASTSGTWTNTPPYTSIGLGTVVGGSTISATLVGRFVVFTITGTNPTGAAYGGEQFNVAVTNCVVDGVGTLGTYTSSNTRTGYDMLAAIVATWGQRSFIIDTGVVGGSHTVTLTYTGTPGNDKLFVDWFGSWDPSSTSTFNNVLALGIPHWNYRVDYLNDNIALYQTDTRRVMFNKAIEDTCHDLRVTYGLPVYFVDMPGYSQGSLQSDGLHANFPGQVATANRVLSVITNGETNYI